MIHNWTRSHREQRLPASISVPFISVSAHLGIPPYATIAGQNSWNYKVLNPDLSITNPDNLSAQFTFTGAEDESWFYVVLTAIEAHSAPIITSALEAFHCVAVNDPRDLIESLQQISLQTRSMAELLSRMYERNNPDFFYHRIRPFLAGTKGSSELPNGVFYEDKDGSGEYRQYNGPTAAQASTMQFIDIALGISHLPTGSASTMQEPFRENLLVLAKTPKFLEVYQL